ncbi:hypothetical protein P618_200826 [Holospora obtusa F1]|uniref:DDE Tnp4 domain-containing protein n=1 Tax=Holospora obtusa F1 TaxID=1399147 RepID=W6TDX1_HOLOB|nr:transposase family protein [Holospora obtusa]ETZ07006.1 hypothetical protein P618_200826 [Holospora obtusa F1]
MLSKLFITDTEYQGIQKSYSQSALPNKNMNKTLLTKEDKQKNQELASKSVANKNVIGKLKQFKIIYEKYMSSPNNIWFGL